MNYHWMRKTPEGKFRPLEPLPENLGLPPGSTTRYTIMAEVDGVDTPFQFGQGVYDKLKPLLDQGAKVIITSPTGDQLRPWKFDAE